MEIKLPYQYEPRDYQRPFFRALENGYKRFDLVWHRRAGKDISILNATAIAMCDTNNATGYGRVGSYYYFFPTFAQGRKVIWDGMTKDGMKFIDFIPKELRANRWNDEMKIELINGSIFQIIGTDNYDAIMGTNPVWCIFSEFSLQNPKAWEFVRPILKENKGIAIFAYTPRGHNHAYDLHYNVALKNPDTWFSQVLTVEDTKVLSEEDIEQERREGMSDELIAQEYYCSFDMGLEGGYYAKWIQQARLENRILPSLPLDTSRPVHTAWDIGVSDHTSIIFFQVFPSHYNIVDFYENFNEGVQHYIQILQSKGYSYGNHYAPHDINAKSWVNEGAPKIEVARRFGIEFDPLPKLSVQDGIEAGRNVLSKCYFDESKTSLLIHHLENYSRKYNRLMGQYVESPNHDEHSHAADAWRYFAIAEKRPYKTNRDVLVLAQKMHNYLIQHSNKYSGV